MDNRTIARTRRYLYNTKEDVAEIDFLDLNKTGFEFQISLQSLRTYFTPSSSDDNAK